MVRRVFVEKKDGFNMEAARLKDELVDFLGGKYPEIAEIKSLRILRRYDAELLDESRFTQAAEAVFSEPQCDTVFYGDEFPSGENTRFFGVEYADGQYDQKSDSAEQCAEIVTGVKPKVKTAVFYVFEGAGKALSDSAFLEIKKYLINPVDSKEALPDLPLTLEEGSPPPPDVPVIENFTDTGSADTPKKLAEKYGLAMSREDVIFCREWFQKEGRDPTLAELRMLDTYWSDHCRHTTFNTVLEEIKIADGLESPALEKALRLYEETRNEVYGEKRREKTLMDIATIGAKALKKRGMASDVDESPEINACTIKVNAEFDDGTKEKWLLLFKNETHNHPTEIEPFGGAATCLGGAIRDPLSGRAFVYQAMRVTGGGDPGAGLNETLPGKLPQIKIARKAAEGYSSYGNQIGLATGQVAEFYHPGFLAKRMELGAVIGAVPEDWVIREEPVPGDLVILAGGRTGRDGIGGATGSSKVHTGESVESAGAEVQKGNAVEERKLQRLFRNPRLSRLVKRCNDFGAGGVSVAVGELAAGLDIDLDAVPKKYSGLDGTELAISESQERMAVVVPASRSREFIKMAAEENLEAVVIAKVTAGVENEENARLRMSWRGKTIIDLSREFLNSNGAPRKAAALLKAAENGKKTLPQKTDGNELSAAVLLDALERELAGTRSGSRRGLQERFDGSIGAASVLFPWGGCEQGTPECGMAALLPSLEKKSRTASLMTFGYDPFVMEKDPYKGAKGSIFEALAKIACMGGDPFKARLSFQEYFQRPKDPLTWGQPAAALLGALEAQLRLGVPAIGGKDSMSGNYRDEINGTDIAVPPVLAAFAAGTVNAEKVRGGALSGKSGNIIVLLGRSNTDRADEWEHFKANMKTLENLAASGTLKAAYPVAHGGVAVSLALMAFGNMCGVEAYSASFSQIDPLYYQGSVLAEIDETAIGGAGGELTVAGKIISEKVFRIVKPVSVKDDIDNPEEFAAETPLEVLRRAYEYPLAQVYPQTSLGATVAEAETFRGGEKEIEIPAFDPAAAGVTRKNAVKCAKPLAVIPVFPGTNCEWDMERAFREAGAKTRLVIFKNRGREDIAASLKEISAAFGEAQIIAFSGGFSAGDEPDGSGKFIANVLRSEIIAAGVTDFLEKRGGLILGICNGFQALIKTGLVPYGRIVKAEAGMPTLTFNSIGRHVSRMVRTRVMPNVSPWLALEETGNIHVIPVSHGEGRLAIQSEEARALFKSGQAALCYAGADGSPTMAEPDNPNGSAFAIEGLTSPDGRILGKMGHSERSGGFVHINIPGRKHMRIFEAGIKYFS